MDYTIVDRRGTSKDKNSANRQKFLKKVKDQLKKSVKEGFKSRSISSDDGHDVTITTDGIGEPMFGNDSNTGKTDSVIPGNKTYKPGDLIEKPKQGSGGKGRDGSNSGEGEDEFTFTITKEEFYELLFEDLELPNLIKTSDKDVLEYETHQAGYTSNGTPASLALVKTMRNSLGRRLALKRPSDSEVTALLLQIEELKNKEDSEEELLELEKQLESLRKKLSYISYIDPIDLRYKNFEKFPKPVSKAVMFCVMDVSGSMSEFHKELGKKFFMIMFWFLKKKYEKVEIVFVRHHTRAKEVDEEEFFYGKETGGTVVSEAFKLVSSIQKQRYSPIDYNIYCSSISDGDNYETDNLILSKILQEDILPICQQFTYVEVDNSESRNTPFGRINFNDSSLMKLYTHLSTKFKHMQAKVITQESELYTVFKTFFEKKKEVQ